MVALSVNGLKTDSSNSKISYSSKLESYCIYKLFFSLKVQTYPWWRYVKVNNGFESVGHGHIWVLCSVNRWIKMKVLVLGIVEFNSWIKEFCWVWYFVFCHQDIAILVVCHIWMFFPTIVDPLFTQTASKKLSTKCHWSVTYFNLWTNNFIT